MNEITKIPKGLSEILLSHPDYYSLLLFLQLKPLFVSGCIHSESGKYPYQRISEITNLAQSTVRYKLKRLLQLDLISYDNKKNLLLKSYNALYDYVKQGNREKPRKKRVRCYFVNSKDVPEAVHFTAIKENYNKQAYNLKEKLFILFLSLKTGYGQSLQNGRIGLTKPVKKFYRKEFNEKYEYLVSKELENFKVNYECRTINKKSNLVPFITLTLKGLANLYNLQTVSGGFYWSEKLTRLNFITKKSVLHRTYNEQPAYDKMNGITNVWNAPKNWKMFLLRLPNQITLNNSLLCT